MEIFISAIWMEENKKDGRRDKTIPELLWPGRDSGSIDDCFNVGDLSLISF